jgi:hypothetical protein
MNPEHQASQCEPKSTERKSVVIIGLDPWLIDFGQTAEAVVTAELQRQEFDCVLIGAGVRAAPGNFILFEKRVNVVHEHAPNSKICFNTNPSDTLDALQRWI